MRILLLSLLAPLALSWCDKPDETIYGQIDRGVRWELVSLGGRPAEPGFQIGFPGPRQITGQTSCGPFKAAQEAPYPWIEIGALSSPDKGDCKDPRSHRSAYLALRTMGIADVAGDMLMLSDPEGAAELVFRRVGSEPAEAEPVRVPGDVPEIPTAKAPQTSGATRQRAVASPRVTAPARDNRTAGPVILLDTDAFVVISPL
ncbi:hypothetical protein BV394_10505 [Brevirhabdus pacifica]|uniref:Uncharacterized protein n=1 Tax=Brevirhabdus pacifica TaxID=1267768 RepID=A0A1U7DJB0_9RHOB|nr:hypothetical protein [Brevirhabdus pacifica]APX90097.1 hypothetical protein BV394_10505 [Brevirhabdus pacifica]PJJ82649.1 hypothetical protein CLV77_2423 [Brevirhabdus pacifica]